MNFDKLPNELLVSIFRKICLQKRIQLRSVSYRWCHLIEDMCHSAGTVKLFGTRYDRGYRISIDNDISQNPAYAHSQMWKVHDDEDLVIADGYCLNRQTCDLLARLFANVHKLVVYFNSFELWQCAPYLLNKFSFINCLSLCGFYSEGENITVDEHIPNQILSAVDSMHSLKELDLLVDYLFYYEPENEQREFVTMKHALPRFSRFNLKCFDDLEIECSSELFCGMIELLGPDCVQLRLSTIFPEYFGIFKSFRENPHLPNSVKYLQLDEIYDFPEDYNLIASMISILASLEHLSINFWFKFSITNEKLHSLRNLANLSQLSLYSRKKFGSRYGIIYIPAKFYVPCKHFISPFVSVKILSLLNLLFSCYDEDDDENVNEHANDENEVDNIEFDCEQFCKTISVWFPNLEELNIYIHPSETNIQIDELEKNVFWFAHLTKHQFGRMPYCRYAFGPI